eukprot:6481630-Amphidinium_carterae.1
MKAFKPIPPACAKSALIIATKNIKGLKSTQKDCGVGFWGTILAPKYPPTVRLRESHDKTHTNTHTRDFSAQQQSLNNGSKAEITADKDLKCNPNNNY